MCSELDKLKRRLQSDDLHRAIAGAIENSRQAHGNDLGPSLVKRLAGGVRTYLLDSQPVRPPELSRKLRNQTRARRKARKHTKVLMRLLTWMVDQAAEPHPDETDDCSCEYHLMMRQVVGYLDAYSPKNVAGVAQLVDAPA